MTDHKAKLKPSEPDTVENLTTQLSNLVNDIGSSRPIEIRQLEKLSSDLCRQLRLRYNTVIFDTLSSQDGMFYGDWPKRFTWRINHNFDLVGELSVNDLNYGKYKEQLIALYYNVTDMDKVEDLLKRVSGCSNPLIDTSSITFFNYQEYFPFIQKNNISVDVSEHTESSLREEEDYVKARLALVELLFQLLKK